MSYIMHVKYVDGDVFLCGTTRKPISFTEFMVHKLKGGKVIFASSFTPRPSQFRNDFPWYPNGTLDVEVGETE